MDFVVDFVENLETTLLALTGSVAVIGVLGLGLMYVGSTLPLISQWKQDNPQAFRDVTWGLIFLIFASGGGIAALLST